MLIHFRPVLSILGLIIDHFFIQNAITYHLIFQQLVKLAKKLKKEKVNVDVINFGEEVIFFC